MKNSEIIIKASELGIVGVEIHADDPSEKAVAHLLLAAVSAELDALDQALKSMRPPN